MKKMIIICMALLAISSCKKENNIVPLTDEDAAAIPYQMGQTVKFLNQDNDTVAFQVTWEETRLSDYHNDHNYLSEPLDFSLPLVYCYARSVKLTSETYPFFMIFTIYPEKVLSFNWNNDLDICRELLPTDETFSINGTTYEHVTHDRLYNQYTGEMLYDWYYNEELGLLHFEKDDVSLTRVP